MNTIMWYERRKGKQAKFNSVTVDWIRVSVPILFDADFTDMTAWALDACEKKISFNTSKSVKWLLSQFYMFRHNPFTHTNILFYRIRLPLYDGIRSNLFQFIVLVTTDLCDFACYFFVFVLIMFIISSHTVTSPRWICVVTSIASDATLAVRTVRNICKCEQTEYGK